MENFEQENGKVFDELKEYAKANHVPIMEDASLAVLLGLVARFKPKKILEIGAAIGYSGSKMLSVACAETVLTTVEINEARYDKAKQTFKRMGFSERVNLIFGDACEVLPNMSGRYDFVLLDAAKGQYKNFYEYVLGLLASGGALVCDNVYSNGEVLGEPSCRRNRTVHNNLNEFLTMIRTDDRVISRIMDVGDGISVSIKKPIRRDTGEIN